MKHCINQTTQGCVLSGDCRCTKQLEDNVHTGVMLKQYEKEIEKLKKDVEKLKDQTRDIEFANGNGKH